MSNLLLAVGILVGVSAAVVIAMVLIDLVMGELYGPKE